MARLFERLHVQGIVASLDATWSTAPRPLADVEAALPHTDIFMPNQGEAEQLADVAPGAQRMEDLADFFLVRGARALDTLLFGVTTTDPATFVTVTAVLLAVAAGACFVAARPATSADPAVALRQE